MEKMMIDDIDVAIVEKCITVQYVIIDDIEFELDDLFATLDAIEFGGARITNKQMADTFLKYGVIKSSGTTYTPAELGPNFKQFYEYIEKIL